MENKSFLFFIALIAAAGAAIAYLTYDDYLLRQNKTDMENEIAQATNESIATSKEMNDEIKNLNEMLAATKDELATTTAERDNYIALYNDEKNRMDDFNSQIGNIQGQVGTLTKLSQTDPELLKKYSKIYFLNENYVPKSFVKIDAKYTFNPKEDYLFYAETWPFLQNLTDAAKSDDIDIEIVSAYRSYGTQSSLKSTYKMIYGSGANKFSADQGYSEHQLGTTVDFTTKKVGASFTGFESTDTYQWLLDNAYRYGFIMSYPKSNKYYVYEPWHWRFVGRALAKKLHDDGDNFYDLDQREIDRYLVSFFD